MWNIPKKKIKYISCVKKKGEYKIHYIYTIKNIKTNQYYIGLTNNYKRRKKRHFSDLRNQKHDNIKLQRSFNKYGEDNFEFIVLLEKNCSREEINELEIKFIKKYNAFNKGFNLNEGGNQNNGFSSRFNRETILYILSAIEFCSKTGGAISKIFNTTYTEVCGIKNGTRHEKYKIEYDNLLYEDRFKLYNEFCEKYNFLFIKKNTTVYKSLRKLSIKQVLFCLSVIEFGYRKMKPMSKFLNVDRNTLLCIKKGNSYQDIKLLYDNLNNEKRQIIYNNAIKYFNF